MRDLWSETLEFELGTYAGYPCVRLTGEGDRDSGPRLKDTLQRAAGEGTNRVILDTRSVRFLDPTCTEAILNACAELEEEGGLVVVVDESLPVERTLKLMDLERALPVFSTTAQATAYLRAHC